MWTHPDNKSVFPTLSRKGSSFQSTLQVMIHRPGLPQFSLPILSSSTWDESIRQKVPSEDMRTLGTHTLSVLGSTLWSAGQILSRMRRIFKTCLSSEYYREKESEATVALGMDPNREAQTWVRRKSWGVGFTGFQNLAHSKDSDFPQEKGWIIILLLQLQHLLNSLIHTTPTQTSTRPLHMKQKFYSGKNHPFRRSTVSVIFSLQAVSKLTAIVVLLWK